eukprot:GHRR01032268.1.p1 GENE.GHRR01032268.1~~GHRR01032268.1.p1  ORF type:complete len:216 (+),score=59.41 GHRR01032268.1:98-649(+)
MPKKVLPNYRHCGMNFVTHEVGVCASQCYVVMLNCCVSEDSLHHLFTCVDIGALPPDTALQVAPKRAALAAARESLNNTLEELASAQARLAAVQEKIAALEVEFEEATAKKAALAAQVADCQVKLQRADKLIGGLGGERSRWTATVKQLQIDLDNLVGDVVLAAGQIRGLLTCVGNLLAICLL